jgi:hypothetical protein
VAVLHRGGSRNPDVLLVETPAGRAVVKDFAPRSFWVRAWLGPWLNRREMRAYRRLEGCASVPRCLGAVDRLAFAVEYRPGQPLSRRVHGRTPPGFADALEQAVRELHERGVVHLDLRHRSNVLLGQDGRPVLLDLASALCLRPGGLAARLLLPLFARLDLRAVGKWRARLQGAAGGGSSAAGRGASLPT